eukprot:30828-Pelagococcus_subviridis.AAC.37
MIDDDLRRVRRERRRLHDVVVEHRVPEQTHGRVHDERGVARVLAAARAHQGPRHAKHPARDVHVNAPQPRQNIAATPHAGKCLPARPAAVNEFDAIAGCARFATACAAATLSCSFVTRDASECAELTSPAAVAIETHALRSCNAVGVCADATRDDLQSRHAVIACVAHVTTFSLALSSSAWKLEGEVDSRTHDAAVQQLRGAAQRDAARGRGGRVVQLEIRGRARDTLHRPMRVQKKRAVALQIARRRLLFVRLRDGLETFLRARREPNRLVEHNLHDRPKSRAARSILFQTIARALDEPVDELKHVARERHGGVRRRPRLREMQTRHRREPLRERARVAILRVRELLYRFVRDRRRAGEHAALPPRNLRLLRRVRDHFRREVVRDTGHELVPVLKPRVERAHGDGDVLFHPQELARDG